MLEFLLSLVLAVVSSLLAIVGAGYAKKNKIGLYQIKSPRVPRNPEQFMRDISEARAHLKAAKRSDMKFSFNSGKPGPEEIWANLE